MDLGVYSYLGTYLYIHVHVLQQPGRFAFTTEFNRCEHSWKMGLMGGYGVLLRLFDVVRSLMYLFEDTLLL